MANELTGQEVISELVTRLRARFTTNQFRDNFLTCEFISHYVTPNP